VVGLAHGQDDWANISFDPAWTLLVTNPYWAGPL
jgi:hypothetical protein